MRRRQCFETVLVGKCILRREGLARILHSANFRVLASVSCADELLTSKVQLHQPLFIILQNAGDESRAAVEQIEFFKSRHPDGRIAVVADRYRLNELVAAFRAGATGYFVDVMTCDVFIKSIELVMMGETVFPPAFLSFVLDPEADHPDGAAPFDTGSRAFVASDDRIAPQLSPREKSILRCLIEGDSNKCIARKIDIAEATVKVHIKAILRKIRVQNRTQAAIWGMNNRSLARSPYGNGANLHSDAEQFPNSAGEIADIKAIEAVVPLTAIDHRTKQYCADGHISKDINLKTAGAMRFRKQSAP
jgi:two-component system nitrate/nitrite response regulator NarL